MTVAYPLLQPAARLCGLADTRCDRRGPATRKSSTMGTREFAWSSVVLLWLAWALKDLLMYRLVKPAYVVDERTEVEKLIGATAVVRRPLEPVGYLQLRSELWRAEAGSSEELPILPGERLRVQATRGLTLIVGRLREKD